MTAGIECLILSYILMIVSFILWFMKLKVERKIVFQKSLGEGCWEKAALREEQLRLGSLVCAGLALGLFISAMYVGYVEMENEEVVCSEYCAELGMGFVERGGKYYCCNQTIKNGYGLLIDCIEIKIEGNLG